MSRVQVPVGHLPPRGVLLRGLGVRPQTLSYRVARLLQGGNIHAGVVHRLKLSRCAAQSSRVHRLEPRTTASYDMSTPRTPTSTRRRPLDTPRTSINLHPTRHLAPGQREERLVSGSFIVHVGRLWALCFTFFLAHRLLSARFDPSSRVISRDLFAFACCESIRQVVIAMLITLAGLRVLSGLRPYQREDENNLAEASLWVTFLTL